LRRGVVPDIPVRVTLLGAAGCQELISLFAQKNTLLRENNSLFRCLGKLAANL